MSRELQRYVPFLQTLDSEHFRLSGGIHDVTRFLKGEAATTSVSTQWCITMPRLSNSSEGSSSVMVPIEAGFGETQRVRWYVCGKQARQSACLYSFAWSCKGSNMVYIHEACKTLNKGLSETGFESSVHTENLSQQHSPSLGQSSTAPDPLRKIDIVSTWQTQATSSKQQCLDCTFWRMKAAATMNASSCAG